ncbi:hypothetical protein F5878DRAFT_699548 [Lentinula raphanica]|uniref:Uncharacterized protein n=1 Tax=Lentinula raphanica TaxID=153919 RepID=A0AA38UCL2_9AGAR|nr:hypothetical protein F5880DRAFT_1616818 [Lentinula raphanica]KAJ3833522.1 hypothetical protein F5878DRAFT_699548 [Lentinula raphanica]
MLYDKAPYGFYVAPTKPEGDLYLFKFMNGNNALNAYYEAVQAPRNSNIPKHTTSKPNHLYLSSGNQMNQQFNSLPMRTDQQSYSGTGSSSTSYLSHMQLYSGSSSPINYPVHMQSSRMATSDSIRRLNTSLTAKVPRPLDQNDENYLLPLQGISIREDLPKTAWKIYYYLLIIVNDGIQHPPDYRYRVLIDTGSPESWLFAMNFEYIRYQIIPSPIGGESQNTPEIVADWPQRLWPKESGIKWPKMVYLPNINNWSTIQSDLRFGHRGVDDSHVVVKRSPKHTGVSVILFGWDWHKQKTSENGFKISRGFDYVVAANEAAVRKGYDGSIGLAPRMERPTNPSISFLDSMFGTHIQEANGVSIFIIRLLHPDVLANKDPWNCPLYNIISFGPEFPFRAPVNPDAHFSAPIPTTSSVGGRPENWKVKLLRIGIFTVGSDDYAWINMNDPSVSTSTRGNQGIDIYMDTGSPMSIFPDHVVSRMMSDKHWLGSPGHTVSDHRSPSITPKTYEDLSSKYISFQFQGAGPYPVEVKVQARIFLSWYPTLEKNNEYKYYRSIKATQGDLYVLGQNWYWSAVVKHAIPVETHTAPYIQVMPNGYFYDTVTGKLVRPEDMVMKELSPRLHH